MACFGRLGPPCLDSLHNTRPPSTTLLRLSAALETGDTCGASGPQFLGADCCRCGTKEVARFRVRIASRLPTKLPFTLDTTRTPYTTHTTCHTPHTAHRTPANSRCLACQLACVQQARLASQPWRSACLVEQASCSAPQQRNSVLATSQPIRLDARPCVLIKPGVSCLSLPPCVPRRSELSIQADGITRPWRTPASSNKNWASELVAIPASKLTLCFRPQQLRLASPP